MKTWIANVSDYWGKISAEAGMEPFKHGLQAGLALGLILVLLLILIWLILRGRRQSNGVRIASESGELFITVNAIREFAVRILGEFGEASLSGLTMREKRGVLSLKLELDVLPHTAVVPLVERLRERLIQQAGETLGIERELRVDVAVRSLTAKPSKIARQNRKAGGNPNATQTSIPLPLNEDDSL
jgi:hypothetical protein